MLGGTSDAPNLPLDTWLKLGRPIYWGETNTASTRPESLVGRLAILSNILNGSTSIGDFVPFGALLGAASSALSSAAVATIASSLGGSVAGVSFGAWFSSVLALSPAAIIIAGLPSIVYGAVSAGLVAITKGIIAIIETQLWQTTLNDVSKWLDESHSITGSSFRDNNPTANEDWEAGEPRHLLIRATQILERYGSEYGWPKFRAVDDSELPTGQITGSILNPAKGVDVSFFTPSQQEAMTLCLLAWLTLSGDNDPNVLFERMKHIEPEGTRQSGDRRPGVFPGGINYKPLVATSRSAIASIDSEEFNVGDVYYHEATLIFDMDVDMRAAFRGNTLDNTTQGWLTGTTLWYGGGRWNDERIEWIGGFSQDAKPNSGWSGANLKFGGYAPDNNYTRLNRTIHKSEWPPNGVSEDTLSERDLAVLPAVFQLVRFRIYRPFEFGGSGVDNIQDYRFIGKLPKQGIDRIVWSPQENAVLRRDGSSKQIWFDIEVPYTHIDAALLATIEQQLDERAEQLLTGSGDERRALPIPLGSNALADGEPSNNFGERWASWTLFVQNMMKRHADPPSYPGEITINMADLTPQQQQNVLGLSIYDTILIDAELADSIRWTNYEAVITQIKHEASVDPWKWTVRMTLRSVVAITGAAIPSSTLNRIYWQLDSGASSRLDSRNYLAP